jgi:regulation of enolase protein 1 (concanavalin A-like superfamily)
MRSLSVAVLLVSSFLASAAPDPPDSDKEKVQKVFGTIEDPDKDCRFAMVKDKLELTMKGGKQYDYFEKLKNCPRALKEVKGDFVATVRAYAALPEKAQAAAGETAEVGAGLIVLDENGRDYRTGMHDFRGKDRHLMLVIPGAHGAAGLQLRPPAGRAYTRFTRKGDSLTLSISSDGEKWKEVLSMSRMKFGESLRVGVYGFSNSKDDTRVVLDKFRITPLLDKTKTKNE